MKTTAGVAATPLLTPEIRARILVSRLDPLRVVELVEYTDGRVGIHENGVPVGDTWKLGRIEACVRSFCSLAEDGRPRVAIARRGRRLPAPPRAVKHELKPV